MTRLLGFISLIPVCILLTGCPQGAYQSSNWSTVSSTESSSGQVWCATADTYWRVGGTATKEYCREHLGGLLIQATASQAKAEHRRLKAASTASFSDSKMIWCATKYSVNQITKDSCKNREGKAYSSEYLAKAEQNRLKTASTPVVKTNSVTIQSNVIGDRVYIDNVYKGSTRLNLKLPKGRHTIRIEKEGYETYEETINLTDNLIIRGNLEKIVEKPVQTVTADKETVFWQSIVDSNNADMFRAYLDEHPKGKFSKLAKIKLKKLGGDTTVASSIPDLDYGKYYALVIGNDRYQYLDNLETPREDARLIAATLKRDYGFDVNLLSNATRADMFEALEHYRRTSTSQDNLLIYYAGHGVLDQEADEGFWLPVDAKEDSQLNWIPNADIIRSVSSMQAKHVMVVADSCFSGTLIRALTIKQKTPDYLTRISKKKARVAMTSGSDEPVTDVGGGGNSAFAKAFLNLLDENTGVLDGHSMFTQLRRRVMINTKQTPQYGDMRGHEDGDFLFVRQ